jgi:chromosome segregation ATPase
MIRYLPSDNAKVPRRVRAVTPEWRKNSVTKTQMAQQLADAQRKIDQLESEKNTLMEELSQAKGTTRGVVDKLASTQMELQTRDSQLAEANETMQVWQFVACDCHKKLVESKMAHRATQMELQTRDSQLIEANETICSWMFLAWFWFFENEENEIAHGVTLNWLLDKCQRL